MNNTRTGALIKELRKERGLTQRELADALHITDRAVSKWERGLSAPDIALLEPLSDLFGVTVGELIRGERTAEEQEIPTDETRSLLDYSKEEVERKVGSVRKKYLGLLAGCLALVLLIGGTILWRCGVFFLVDKKTSPDGRSMVRVYDKQWGEWPFRSGILEDSVRIVLEEGEERTYITYGNSEYQGLWWSPDGRKYVLSIRRNWEDEPRLSLHWLDRHSEWNLDPILNMGGKGTEYQFLQWGKDSASMLFYYSLEGEEPDEGYFWYNCTTGQISGIVAL